MTKNLGILLGTVSGLGFLIFAASAYAATPTFTLSQSGSSFILSVSGGPGISPVYFYYYDANQNGSMTGQLIGTTNADGNLATPVTFTTSTYNGIPGWPTYVMVGAVQSAIQNWPGTATVSTSTASSGSLSFDFQNLNMPVGGSATATIYGGGGNTVSSNSNSSVASASVNGNNLVVNGLAAGTANITICSSSNACGTVTATVSGSSATTTSTATIVVQPVITSTSSALAAILSIQAQIAQILSQIQSINMALVQIASNLGVSAQTAQAVTPTASQVLGVSTFNFTQLLKFGSNGPEVTALQKYLAKKGLLTAAPNGNFGPSTEAALKEYQSSLGLEPVGYVGNATRAALNAGK